MNDQTPQITPPTPPQNPAAGFTPTAPQTPVQNVAPAVPQTPAAPQTPIVPQAAAVPQTPVPMPATPVPPLAPSAAAAPIDFSAKAPVFPSFEPQQQPQPLQQTVVPPTINNTPTIPGVDAIVETPSSSHKKMILIVGLVTLALLIIGGIFVMMSRQQPSPLEDGVPEPSPSNESQTNPDATSNGTIVAPTIPPDSLESEVDSIQLEDVEGAFTDVNADIQSL